MLYFQKDIIFSAIKILKIQISKVCNNTKISHWFGVEINVRNDRKRVSRMWENAYLSTENPRASRALKRALDPGCIWLALLTWLGFATLAIFSLGRNSHFQKIWSFCHGNMHILPCAYINYKLKNFKKRSQEKWENAYLTLKNARASRALRRALDPGQ